MLHVILADDDLLTTLGRIAALVLVIYVFLFAMVFFLGSLLLLYGNAWLREKTVLVHQLRSIVETLDTVLHTSSGEPLPATVEPDSRLGQAFQAIHTVQSVQAIEKAKNTHKQVENIEKKVEPVADRITDGVIEFRARTVMAQSILKAFFLPGLTKPQPQGPLLLPEASDTHGSIATEISAKGSNTPDITPKVVVTPVDPPDVVIRPTAMSNPEHTENEVTKRNDNAPGH